MKEKYDILSVKKEDIFITTDKSKLDIEFVYNFLSTSSYWAKNIQKDRVYKAIENSLCFGVFHKDKQIGFARVVSDFSTLAFIKDVFIIEEYRGQGLGKYLMENIMNYPDLQDLKKWLLGTRDAHELYKKFGFKSLENPNRFMEINNPDIYG